MTTNATGTRSTPDELAEHYSQVAKEAAKRQRTMLGTCPRCQGNVIRITIPPAKQAHAKCMQCSRDLCCPAIRSTASPPR